MTWLITSLGTSPSVLTEAIWYLETGKNLRVDRLTCVGTADSWEKARTELFQPGGAFDRLRRHLGRSSDWLTEGNGFSKHVAEASDNRSLDEAKAMDQAFRQAIRDAQNDPEHDGEVVACISGGRKTMSSSLQQAMSLLARSQDWAFHVLLNLPGGIVEREVTESGFGFPGDPVCPRFQGVGVDAFEVPLVRLREIASTKGIDLADEALVQKLQQAVDSSRTLPRLDLELRTLRLSSPLRPGWGRRLSPQHTLVLAAFAYAQKPKAIDEAASAMKTIIQIWRNLDIEENSADFPTAFADLEAAVQNWQGEDAAYFNQQCSRLKRELLDADPTYHVFALRARGQRGDGIKGFDEVVYDNKLIQIVF